LGLLVEHLLSREEIPSTEEASMRTMIEAVPVGNDERLVYSVAEAGALLGISRAFAYELVARGELPVIRLGRRRLVPKAALLALIALERTGEVESGGGGPAGTGKAPKQSLTMR
jgi:excisionase family DNA binding protein